MAKILVMDDDNDIRLLMRTILEKVGHDVVEAGDGCEGMQLYREVLPDLVIADILMPKKDGWVTILELRRDFPDVKVIAISGGGQLGPFSYLMLAKRFGARQILSKPLHKESLLAAVNQLLSGEFPPVRKPSDTVPREQDKKSILVVDEDPNHAWALCEGLTRAGHTVTDVPKPQHALTIMADRRFEVAIVDVFSLKVGDIDLVHHLSKLWPPPLIVVMADFAALAVKKAVIRRGANHFVGKPVDVDHLLAVISPPTAFCGTVHGVDILEYIQFMLLSGQRTVLEVHSEREGLCRLFFDKGDVVHAVSQDRMGEEAFYQCTGFKGGRFVNLPWSEPQRRSIERPGELMLVEAARRRDAARSMGK